MTFPISITMQYSSKMKMRDIPVLLEHYRHRDTVPERFSLGFAAYLLRQPELRILAHLG